MRIRREGDKRGLARPRFFSLVSFEIFFFLFFSFPSSVSLHLYSLQDHPREEGEDRDVSRIVVVTKGHENTIGVINILRGSMFDWFICLSSDYSRTTIQAISKFPVLIVQLDFLRLRVENYMID